LRRSTMAEFEFSYPESPEYIGFVSSVGMLKDDQVREFIAAVREREGILAPVDREELAENLEQYPPERFEEEALPVADEYLARVIFEENLPGLDLEGMAERARAQLPAQLADVFGSLGGLLEDFLQVDTSVPTAAGVIARHIVTGCLEVPEGIPTSMAAVGKLSFGPGDSMLVAMISPHADIEVVAEEIKDTFRQHYVTGERRRLPARLTETLWLRHCEYELNGDPADESSHRKLAELALEIWPELRPSATGNTPEWRAAVEQQMERFRKNSKAWEERKERGLWGPEA
jgi:hypothetical protein